jgi:hypothetical protein
MQARRRDRAHQSRTVRIACRRLFVHECITSCSLQTSSLSSVQEEQGDNTVRYPDDLDER